MEIIDRKGIEEQIETDEVSITNMLLLEVAVQLEKLVELQNAK